jgi:hypothetical protein
VLSTVSNPDIGSFQETTILNFNIRLVDVMPYPDGRKNVPEDYKIKVIVSK